MAEKPITAAGYAGEEVTQVRALCLYVATKLGDLMNDLVVVGGLVPSLLIDQDNLGEGGDAHVGTMDLDVGLTVALLEEGRYRALTERLRRAGFEQDKNPKGNPTCQRWKVDRIEKVTIDFLIQPTLPDDKGGGLRDIEHDFAALIAPGLNLAFEDRQSVTLSGQTIMGEDASRAVWVCGPGAYVVLKALAFDLRGENKDAYDLFYLLRNYGNGPWDVSEALRPLLGDETASQAVDVLKRDFMDHNGVGPRRVAEFLVGGPEDVIQADVVGVFTRLLDLLKDVGPP